MPGHHSAPLLARLRRNLRARTILTGDSAFEPKPFPLQTAFTSLPTGSNAGRADAVPSVTVPLPSRADRNARPVKRERRPTELDRLADMARRGGEPASATIELRTPGHIAYEKQMAKRKEKRAAIEAFDQTERQAEVGRIFASDRATVASLLKGVGNMTGEQVRNLRRQIYEKQVAGEISRDAVRAAQSVLTSLIVEGGPNRRNYFVLEDHDIEREIRRLNSPPVVAGRKLVSMILGLKSQTRKFAPLPEMMAEGTVKELASELRRRDEER